MPPRGAGILARAAPLALGLLAFPAFAGGPACTDSAGPAQARQYVKDCLAVSPATRPPCNARNSCGLILDEIRRGCSMLGTGRPRLCGAYDPAPPRR